MHRAGFFPAWGEMCGNGLQHDDVVPPDDIDDRALDVRHAFLNERRPDHLCRNGREPEPGEFVGVRPRAGAYADDLVQHVHGGDGDHALPGLSEGLERVVPLPGGDGEFRGEVHHHGP